MYKSLKFLMPQKCHPCSKVLHQMFSSLAACSAFTFRIIPFSLLDYQVADLFSKLRVTEIQVLEWKIYFF